MSAAVVVIGGGLAGIRTCGELRRQGFAGEIILIGEESHPPYDRPPLSKAALLGAVDSVLLHDAAELAVTLRLGTRAVGLNTVDRTVYTDAGEIGYTSAVLATGATAIRLPGAGPQLTLRTRGDAVALQAHLARRARLVIIGASWIGAEVATAALARGCAVTCIEGGGLPLGAVFGESVARELLPWWRDVALRTGTGVRSVEEGGVLLADGSVVEADVVLTAVGARPCTDWLHDSGLLLDHGVVVDAELRASQDGVFAVGDVARRWSPRWERFVPGGHWDDAAEAPAVVAAGIVHPTAGSTYDPVPYFWSDQFGHKLQFTGVRDAADTAVARRAADGRLLGVGWLDVAGTLRAYLAVDRPRDLLLARLSIAAGARPDPGRLADPAITVRAA